MRMCCQLKAKASPRGRASYRSAKASAAPLFCRSRDPRRMRGFCPLKARASPRCRASHRSAKSSTRTAFLWEPRPAANAGALPAQKQKLRPEVGPPTEEPKAPLAPLFCGRRDPRRMRMFCQLISKSFAPRSGLPRKQCTALICGRRASRRIQASESLSRAAPRSVRRARQSRRRRAETGYARLAPRRSSEPRPRLPPAAFQVAMR